MSPSALPCIPALTVDLIGTELDLVDESPRDVPDCVLVDQVARRGRCVLLLPALAVVAHLLLPSTIAAVSGEVLRRAVSRLCKVCDQIN